MIGPRTPPHGWLGPETSLQPSLCLSVSVSPSFLLFLSVSVCSAALEVTGQRQILTHSRKTQLPEHMCNDNPKKVKNFLERVKSSKYGYKLCQDINK